MQENKLNLSTFNIKLKTYFYFYHLQTAKLLQRLYVNKIFKF